MIKKLVWYADQRDVNQEPTLAQTPFCLYSCVYFKGSWFLLKNGYAISEQSGYKTLEDCQTAAQKDFETLVSQCLV